MIDDIIYSPFVYLIRHIPSGKFYAGSRTAKGCHYSDLWTNYFTSSKYVKELINSDGIDSFQILMIFECVGRNNALQFETTLLKAVDAAKSRSWLNKTNSDGKFSQTGIFTINCNSRKAKFSKERKKCKPYSLERRLNMSAGKIGVLASESHKANISASLKGRKHSSEAIAKISAAHRGSKRSNETCEKMRISQTGKVLTSRQKSKISESMRNLSKITCSHCRTDYAPSPFARYHGDKCKQFNQEPIITQSVIK